LLFGSEALVEINQKYFELFGLKESYDLDVHELRGFYQELQLKFHPDRYVDASDAEQRLSVQYTSYINDAYETLRNPLPRAMYMLQLMGVDFEHETTIRDSGFLIQQMHLREQLEGVRQHARPDDALQQFLEHVRRELRQLETDFGDIANVEETEEEVELDLVEAEQVVRKMQFLSKLEKEAVKLESELFDY